MARRGAGFVATCAVAALAVGGSTAAIAEPPDSTGVVERAADWSAPLFWDGELVVLVGPPLEQGCLDQGWSHPTWSTVSARGGVTITHYTDVDRVWVFDDEGVADPLDWLLGSACPAVWAGETPPSPLAHGEGHVAVTMREDAEGVVHGNMRFMGEVTTAGGERTHLNVVGAGFGQFPDRINYGG